VSDEKGKEDVYIEKEALWYLSKGIVLTGHGGEILFAGGGAKNWHRKITFLLSHEDYFFPAYC
jgi:hypothetical protein